jgi:hypothetical protein
MTFGRSTRTSEYVIKVDVKQIKHTIVDWIQLAQNWVQ